MKTPFRSSRPRATRASTAFVTTATFLAMIASSLAAAVLFGLNLPPLFDASVLVCSFSLVIYYLPPHLAPAWVFAEPPEEEEEEAVGGPDADSGDKGAKMRLLGAEEEPGEAGGEGVFVNVRDLATWSDTTGDIELAELPPVSTAMATPGTVVSKRTGSSPKRGEEALEGEARGVQLTISRDTSGLIIR